MILNNLNYFLILIYKAYFNPALDDDSSSDSSSSFTDTDDEETVKQAIPKVGAAPIKLRR